MTKQKGRGFIQEIKEKQDIRLFDATKQSRDFLPLEILKAVETE